MDFFDIASIDKGETHILYPNFRVSHSKDLMTRGKSFYAIWDEEAGLWSTDEYDVARLVDKELYARKEEIEQTFPSHIVKLKTMTSYGSKSWSEFKQFVTKVGDCYHQLDSELAFQNSKIKRDDYISKKLPYALEPGSCSAYEELISTLYDPIEREKIEWAIGAIVAGDAKNIQKFMVFYGDAGSGKSTIINIIEKLFQGYTTYFEAKQLGSNNNTFATEAFRNGPLVGIQHDGDLSRIEDNSKLNSIISHENMMLQEKYKSSYSSRINCFLFMATNKPVKITDAKSGIIRRLIDIHPSGRLISRKRYDILFNQIDFELGAIASYCLDVYRQMGKNYYNNYKPFDMMYQTDVFFNFIQDNFDVFKEQDGCSLKQAYALYKDYCEETSLDFKMPRYKFREELRNYFESFKDIDRIDGKQVRSYYKGFLMDKVTEKSLIPFLKETTFPLVLDCTESIFDKKYVNCKAQYANSYEVPNRKWDEVETVLSDIDTKELHYVQPPINHIVIDFDLKDENGEKSLERNIEEASKWPPTYAELSKGQHGIHLHYIYDGDPMQLARLYKEDVEIKVFSGNSSLRRKLSKCNNTPIAHISSGLPLKEKKVINFDGVKNEKQIRDLIRKNLSKEIHANTKPSIDFIYKILDDAYNGGVHYDVSDLRNKVLAFANNSSNQAEYCVKLVSKMHFQSDEPSEALKNDDAPIVFYDVEVFPNLFLINWKYQGKGKKCVRMINPTPQEVEALFHYRLIGFNNRRYDNHILYGRFLGYSNQQLYELSQKLIGKTGSAVGFAEAYNISYTDVYDFASAANKKSLKKWEIELGLHHQELGLPWDQPVPREKWVEVAEYCDNDVYSTEAVFDHLKGDWVARQILAKLSGLGVNHTTNQHSTAIIFGNNKHPQSDFIYTDLSEMFPGYKFDHGKSTYRDEEVGEGGYVYSEPGMYANVALLDVASMHPTSIEQLSLFGPYTKRFSDIKNGRIAIKHNDREKLSNILDGELVPFLEMVDNGEFTLDDLSLGLKTVINSVYGLTSAKFENPFRDPRNIDNIVAKRGALFMIDLKHAVQEKGYTVAHIKTDSIKIPKADNDIIQFVMEFGKKYGYEFEHEATYDKMCLVNDAVYIAKYLTTDKAQSLYGYIPKDCKKHGGKWTATGAQFQHPYVFKTLFSKEPLRFEDYCETKSVQTAIYLDFNENLGEDCHDYQFVGKVGSFVPIAPNCNGGLLVKSTDKKDKYNSVVGAKGYRWMESEMVRTMKWENLIDNSYFRKLDDEAVSDISKYGDFQWFVEEDEIDFPPKDEVPFLMPCKDPIKNICEECSEYHDGICARGFVINPPFDGPYQNVYEVDDQSISKTFEENGKHIVSGFKAGIDGRLKSECSLHTEGGKIYPSAIQEIIIDCMPNIRKEN